MERDGSRIARSTELTAHLLRATGRVPESRLREAVARTGGRDLLETVGATMILGREDLNRLVGLRNDLLQASTELGCELIEPLGSGGMGSVWRAESDSGPIAVKVLDAEAEPGVLARFEREGRIQGRLDHPNIARFLRAGRVGRQACLVMELVEGPALDRHFAEQPEGRMDWRAAVELLLPIADALAVCHDNGLVHRDVKPANILLERRTGRPVLVDFGLAKRVAPDGTSVSGASFSLTRTGQLLGTPAFMAPEQMDAGGVLGAMGSGTDVWGFAATLFRAVAGRSPLEALAPAHALVALASNTMPRLRAEAPAVPAALDDLIAECLDRDPEMRPEMDEVVERLEGLLAPPSRLTRALPALAGLALLLGLGAAGVRTFTPSAPPAKLIELTAPAVTMEASVRLVGTARGSEIILRRKGAGSPLATLPIKEEGAFELTAALFEGDNAFLVEVRGAGPPERRALNIVRDMTAPTLTLEVDAPPKRFGLLDARYVPGAVLAGRLSDDSEMTLRVDDKPVKVGKDGRFRAVIEDRAEPRPVLIAAVDAAGNSVHRMFRIITPKALRVGREALGDRERWAGASDAVRRVAASEIALGLGEDYRLLTIRTFKAGGVENPVALYRHKPSGMTLHLIPGGRYLMGLRELSKGDRAGFGERARGGQWISRLIDQQERWKAALGKTGYRAPDTSRAMTSAAPVHPVIVAPFLIAETELLQSEYRRLVAARPGVRLRLALPVEPPCSFADLRRPGVGIEGIDFRTAIAVAQLAGAGFTLPSEAQWEYACRAGTTTPTFWGGEIDAKRDPHFVFSLHENTGPFLAPDIARGNAFGLIDMPGGWHEWCLDEWKGDYTDGPRSEAPRTFTGESPMRVVRGGARFFPALFGLSGARWRRHVEQKHATGVRLVRALPELELDRRR